MGQIVYQNCKFSLLIFFSPLFDSGYLENCSSLYDVYLNVWLPFGQLLSDMECNGVYVDREHLKEIENRALEDKLKFEQFFKDWASNYCSDAKLVIGFESLRLFFSNLPPRLFNFMYRVCP